MLYIVENSDAKTECTFLFKTRQAGISFMNMIAIVVLIVYIGEFLCKLDRHEEANNSRLTDAIETHQKLYVEWD